MKRIEQEKLILTEGAILERLRREYGCPVEGPVAHAAFVYDQGYAKLLEGIYREYIDVAVGYEMPIMIMTPTRRVDAIRVMKTQWDGDCIIGDNVAFLKKIRNQYPLYKEKIYIGGLTGCRGDAYSTTESLGVEEAREFHSWQIGKFVEAGVDFLFAGIMPALEEAEGMAKAMAASGIPYIISFMIRENGRLLDGTLIHDAIKHIDERTEIKPMGYTVNCIHPKILHKALGAEGNRTELVEKRFLGIQANASALSPEDLNHSAELKGDEAEALAEAMAQLRSTYHLKIYGGCCGTNGSHIDEMARKLRAH